MTFRRSRWLIPRFSLSNLLMLMVVVGLCLAWYDQRRKLGEQADVIEQQRLEITRLTAHNIVLGDTRDEEKAVALQPLISVGSASADIEKWCGEPLHRGFQGKADRVIYFDGVLQVTCDGGVVTDFGYYVNKGGLLIHWSYVSLALGSNGHDAEKQRQP